MRFALIASADVRDSAEDDTTMEEDDDGDSFLRLVHSSIPKKCMLLGLTLKMAILLSI